MDTNIKLPEREVVIPIDKIPNEIYGITLDADNKERLSYGEWSGLLKHGTMEDGTVKDLKIKLEYDPSGESIVHRDIKEGFLQIPKRILDNELSAEQVDMLKKNQIIGPLKHQGEAFYVKVDNELNKITIKSEKEIGVLHEMGGYSFSDREKNQLANGNKVEPKVYMNPDGDYFMAGLRISEDKKGIEFLSPQLLSTEEALELMTKLNAPKTELAGSLVTTFSQINTQELNQVKIEGPVQIKSPAQNIGISM
jgi:hypothetical protein